jgi:hypothetical protein
MTVPANWPTDRLVYPEEALRLAAEGLGLQPMDGYMPAGRVTVRDANGRRLAMVFACCVATGEVIYPRLREGRIMLGSDGEIERMTEMLPAPLQITYETT